MYLDLIFKIMKKLIILSLFLAITLTGCGMAEKNLSPEEAKTKAEDYINNNLIRSETKAMIKEIVEEAGLYKIVVTVGEGEGQQEITSYMDMQGNNFFPQALDMNKKEETDPNAAENLQDSAPQPVSMVNEENKNDKPVVELFVMSHCPYGTQIEKGILPVIETLGEKIDFKLKFCDYAMHGKKEIDEQLNQYCIQKNEPTKLLSYLKCFLEADKGEECLAENKIDTKKLTACVSETDTKYKVSEDYNDKDKTNWKGQFPVFNVYAEDNKAYGIGGSPSLVVNKQTIKASRGSAGLLSVICSAFKEQPEECKTELSNASPAPGFGFGGSGSNSDATCD